MKRAVSLQLALFLLSWGYTAAQGVEWHMPRIADDGIVEPSPQASAMYCYNDIPMTYAMGTANIAIPLLSVAAGDLNVSIGLNYYTGGIRHEDRSGGIGLGWTLTGLGHVSRQINGFPDEWRGISNQVGFNLSPKSSDVDYFLSVLECCCEANYDLYSYVLPNGLSGSFFINSKGLVVQMPPTTMTIERTASTSNARATEAFIITTPDGIEYLMDQQEHIEYTYTCRPQPIPHHDRNYTAVTTWRMSQISSLNTGESIEITYKERLPWSRVQGSRTETHTWTYGEPSAGTSVPTGDGAEEGVSSGRTTFLNQLLPYEIKSRGGNIRFDYSTTTTHLGKSCPDHVNRISLLNPDGITVKTATLVNECKFFEEGGNYLSAITVESDDVAIERYEFDYNGSAANAGYDLFGFFNNKDGYCESVLTQELTINPNRQTNKDALTACMLTGYTDIRGAKTTIRYEPSVIELPVESGSLFTGEVTVGPRIKNITVTDAVTGQRQERRFEYRKPYCSVDLGAWSYRDFIAQSGIHAQIPVGNGGMLFRHVYNMSATRTASSVLPGFPLEKATLYYGEVDEIVTGTSFATPIKTTYHYDLSHVRHNRHYLQWENSLYTGSVLQGYNKHIGSNHQYNSSTSPSIRKIMQALPVEGHNEEMIGPGPLLKEKISYQTINGDYHPRFIQTNHYSVVDSTQMCVGLYVQSDVFKLRRYPDNIYESDITDLSEICHIPIFVSAIRMECDSTTETKIYVDGSRRNVTTSYCYTGVAVAGGTVYPFEPLEPFALNRLELILPGFYCDTLTIKAGAHSYYPLSITKSCGRESLTVYTAMSEHASGLFKEEPYSNIKRMPIARKRIYRAGNHSDSVLLRWEYGKFTRGVVTSIKPLRQYTQYNGSEHERILIDEIRYHDYDKYGRIMSLTDESGLEIKATWTDDTDWPATISKGTDPFTVNYEYRPLVGCSSITWPTGKKERYEYNGNRLVSHYNSDDDLISAYQYTLYNENNDGNSGSKTNCIKALLYDDYGEASQVLYYNSLGRPIQQLNSVAGRSYVSVGTEYDAVGRPVKMYRPISVTDDGYLTMFKTLAVNQYQDTRPFKEFVYGERSDGQSEEIIRESDKIGGHSQKFSYICNSTSQAMLKCARYQLTPSSATQGRGYDGVRHAGLYPCGELDVTQSTDEDGHTRLTFTDWRGLTVMERRVVDTEHYADTYRLYDAIGRVCIILQPRAVELMGREGGEWTLSDDELYELALVYHYDRRGNCTYEKLPGCEPTLSSYDRYNRLLYRATASMQERGRKEVTLYDPMGRVVVRGIMAGTVGYETETAELVATVYYAGAGTVAASAIGDSGYATYDSSLAQQLQGIEITEAYYYDSYEVLSDSRFDQIAEMTVLHPQTVKGSMVASLQAIYSSDEQGNLMNLGPGNSQYILYEYDKEGNMIRSVQRPGVADCILDTRLSYTRQGRVKKTDYNLHTSQGVYTLSIDNRYDPSGAMIERQSGLTIYSAGGTDIRYQGTTKTEYQYNSLGQLARRTVDGRLTTDYAYNVRGELLSSESAPFSHTISYEDGSNPSYNGNISEIAFRYGQQAATVTRSYEYDSVDRLVGTTSTDGFNTSYAYDLNSSPTKIKRYGVTSDGSTGVIDDLTLSYRGNRLTAVTDEADDVLLERSLDFPVQHGEYTYDIEGRLVEDSSRGIEAISYTPTSHTVYVSMNTGTIHYEYSAQGEKLSSCFTPEGMPVAISPVHLYIGPFELNCTRNGSAELLSLSRVNLAEGYFDSQARAYSYHTDWQGNVRVVTDADGGVVQTTDYYPYGMPMATSTAPTVNAYKYSGKELQHDGGLNSHDFHARRLPAVIPLFTTLDPQANSYPGLSPYLYCFANHIMYTDSTGEKPTAYEAALMSVKCRAFVNYMFFNSTYYIRNC